MSDPAIKLFGRTIPLPEGAAAAAGPDPSLGQDGAEKDVCKEAMNNEAKYPASDAPEEMEWSKQQGSSDANVSEVDQQTSTEVDKVTEDPRNEKDQVETGPSGQEKVLKKPDKILPCPRCNSMDTKFCYYNNYNVNQPRHFCKNCQRYWTAGGTMRNVPVGAGRRKNKHSASHQRHMMMLSDGMAAARVNVPDSTPSQVTSCGLSAATVPLKVNGTVLKFGPEGPLCESIASALNLGDQKMASELSSVASGENMDEPSCTSSARAPNGVSNPIPENAVNMKQSSTHSYCNGVNTMAHLQCYPGPSWPYPWSAGWNNPTTVDAGRCSNELANGSENGCPNPIVWNPTAIVAAPAFCPPTIPFPFIPPSFWGCIPTWSCGAWSVPWVGSNGALSPSSSTSNSGCSGNGSPTLGKHSRDASFQGEEKKMEKSLWVPKTLRIDDADEATKSSIWATLGIKPDEGGMFKAFHCKTKNKGQASDASQLLHANPAALSRSQSFQESM